MKISPIFAPHLYAIVYPKDYDTVWNEDICSFFEEDEIGQIDEYERYFDLWSNPLFLENFFDNNKDYLLLPYWRKMNISIEEVAKRTNDKAQTFEKELIDNQTNIESLFRPLDDRTLNFNELSKGKSKKDWLRFYAIKLENNKFLITGGAIKLTHKMEDHQTTRDELIKLEKIKNFLAEHGVIDGDSFNDALYEMTI